MAKYLIAAGLAPLEAVWVRMAGAGRAAGRACWPWSSRARCGSRAPRLPFFAMYAIIAVAGVQSLYFVAITRLPVGVALLLEFMAPVMVVLWVRFVRRVRLARAAYVGAVTAVVGLAIVVEAWSGLRLDALGLLLGLLAGACCAGYFLMSDSFGTDVDPLGPDRLGHDRRGRGARCPSPSRGTSRGTAFTRDRHPRRRRHPAGAAAAYCGWCWSPR